MDPRRYTWGRDLSGDLQSAGTIGGLLAVQDEDAEADYVYFHDALGNVGQVVDLGAGSASTCSVAKYTYDPYGAVSTSSGAYASSNRFRFSTKYWDTEANLGYWGYRYYRPDIGRWLNRDPIGEEGGANLCCYIDNQPIMAYDAYGLTGGANLRQTVSTSGARLPHGGGNTLASRRMRRIVVRPTGKCSLFSVSAE